MCFTIAHPRSHERLGVGGGVGMGWDENLDHSYGSARWQGGEGEGQSAAGEVSQAGKGYQVAGEANPRWRRTSPLNRLSRKPSHTGGHYQLEVTGAVVRLWHTAGGQAPTDLLVVRCHR